jgi:hypothetical protein
VKIYLKFSYEIKMLTQDQFEIIVEMLRGFTEQKPAAIPMDKTKKAPPAKAVKQVVKPQSKPVAKQPARIPTPEPEPEPDEPEHESEITEGGAVKSYSTSYYEANKVAITRRRLLKRLEDGEHVSDKLIAKYKLNE